MVVNASYITSAPLGIFGISPMDSATPFKEIDGLFNCLNFLVVIYHFLTNWFFIKLFFNSWGKSALMENLFVLVGFTTNNERNGIAVHYIQRSPLLCPLKS